MQLEMIEQKLEQRALREGWDIPPGKRKEVIARTIERATSGIPDVEEQATRTLLAADALALKREMFEQRRAEAEHARKLQYIELLVKAGLVVDDNGTTGNVGAIAADVGG